MRRALLSTLILAAVGCGGGGRPNPLIGEWEVDGPGNCAGLITFTDADFASASVCPVSAAAADVTTMTGSYSSSGDTMTLTTQKSTWTSTCSKPGGPPEEAQFSTAGDSLILTKGTTTEVFTRFTSTSQGAGGVLTNSLFAADGTLTLAPGSGFVITTGCLAFDGTFRPAPLAPL
jgi:hypothetical protein